MTIFLDVDGVVADLMPVWLERYNRDFDDSLKPSDITDWEIHKFVKPEAGLAVYNYLNDPTLYDSVKQVDGQCRAVILSLLSMGHRIIYATHCGTDAAYAAKKAWLVNNTLWLGGDNFVAVQDKSLLRGDMLIDDRADNLLSFKGVGVLYDAPYNRYPGLHNSCCWRVHSWLELHRTVIDIASKLKYPEPALVV